MKRIYKRNPSRLANVNFYEIYPVCQHRVHQRSSSTMTSTTKEWVNSFYPFRYTFFNCRSTCIKMAKRDNLKTRTAQKTQIKAALTRANTFYNNCNLEVIDLTQFCHYLTNLMISWIKLSWWRKHRYAQQWAWDFWIFIFWCNCN